MERSHLFSKPYVIRDEFQYRDRFVIPVKGNQNKKRSLMLISENILMTYNAEDEESGTAIHQYLRVDQPPREQWVEQGQISQTGAGRIYGMVVDDVTGKAVTDFRVRMRVSDTVDDPDWKIYAVWRVGHQFTDERAWFDSKDETIPVGGLCRVTILADGYYKEVIDPVAAQVISDNPQRIVFRLRRATTLLGEIVDTKGNPIGKAGVVWFSRNNDLDLEIERQGFDVRSDEHGKFRLKISEEPAGLYVLAPGYGMHFEKVESATDSMKIVLQEAATVTGQVVREGEPVVAASVSAHVFPREMREMVGSPFPGYSTHTDEKGFYTLTELPAKPLGISVNSPLSEGNLNYAQKKIDLKSGEETILNFGDEIGYTLSASITTDKKPIVNASCRIQFSDKSWKWGWTDSQGRFQIHGIPAGTHELFLATNFWIVHAHSKTGGSRPKDLHERRRITIDSDMAINMDLGNVEEVANSQQIITASYLLTASADLPELKGLLSRPERKNVLSRGMLQPQPKIFTADELKEFLQAVSADGKSKVMVQPNILTNDGQAGEFRMESDESDKVVKIVVKSSIEADKKTIMVELDFEYRDADNSVATITAVAIEDGEAMVVAGRILSNGEALLLIVQVEILGESF
jgi:hypothetical protein